MYRIMPHPHQWPTKITKTFPIISGLHSVGHVLILEENVTVSYKIFFRVNWGREIRKKMRIFYEKKEFISRKGRACQSVVDLLWEITQSSDKNSACITKRSTKHTVSTQLEWGGFYGNDHVCPGDFSS